jgi:hypothetical protein
MVFKTGMKPALIAVVLIVHLVQQLVMMEFKIKVSKTSIVVGHVLHVRLVLME